MREGTSVGLHEKRSADLTTPGHQQLKPLLPVSVTPRCFDHYHSPYTVLDSPMGVAEWAIVLPASAAPPQRLERHFNRDIVKDDSGFYAVFTEQGSSAFQMTATKVMHVISRLPGCAGQAADTVAAYTKVKMENAPKLLGLSGSKCPTLSIRLPRARHSKSSENVQDPAVSRLKCVRASITRIIMGTTI